MSTPLLELEGTAEEIQKRLDEFAGQRLRVTVQMLDMLPTGTQHPIDAALEAIWSRVPEASWEQFPEDFGANLDHYLHGMPKRQ